MRDVHGSSLTHKKREYHIRSPRFLIKELEKGLEPSTY